VLLEARRNGFLYRSRRAELHREGHAPDYPATVATPWRLACDQLSAPAWALLNLLAWYAPDTIPLDHLLTPDTDYLTLPDPVNAASQPRLTDPLHQHRPSPSWSPTVCSPTPGALLAPLLATPLRHARRIRSP
jgi:hypothetical protein